MVSMSMMRRRGTLKIDDCDDDLDEIDNSDTDFGSKHYMPLNWGEFAVSQLIADNADGDAESSTTHESIKNKLRNINC